MSDNIIAICLYIGIMAMAGTVLVLTIVYFVKPNPAKQAQSSAPSDNKPVIDDTRPARKKLFLKFPAIKNKSKKKGKEQSATADIKPIADNSEPAHKKNRLKFPVIKMKSKKTDSSVVVKKLPKMKPKAVVPPAVKIKEPENKGNESAIVVPPGKSENEEKQGAAKLESQKPENNEKLIPSLIAVEKSEIKETTGGKSSVEALPENKDLKPQIKPVAQSEMNPAPAPAVQPVPVKSEKPETDTADPSVIEKEKPAAMEAAKKEPEPKMDNKNVKTITNATENPPIPPVTVKTTTTTTTTASSSAPKKGPEQKPSLDDFSQMFAKEVVDDSEATKLAKDMKEVEIDSLVKDGQDLVALLKRGRS